MWPIELCRGGGWEVNDFISIGTNINMRLHFQSIVAVFYQKHINFKWMEVIYLWEGAKILPFLSGSNLFLPHKSYKKMQTTWNLTLLESNLLLQCYKINTKCDTYVGDNNSS